MSTWLQASWRDERLAKKIGIKTFPGNKVLQADPGLFSISAPAVAGNVVNTSATSLWISTDFEVATATPAQKAGEVNLSSDQAFERIAGAIESNATQVQANIDDARRQSSTLFKYASIAHFIAFGTVVGGVILLYFGQGSAGLLSCAAATLSEVVSFHFSRRETVLRQRAERDHDALMARQSLLTLIDFAETISDPDTKNNMKQQIILTSLNVKK
jgi:hypothetical protein